ncbi:MAG: potassium channel family protein [Bacteroidota bacterium]
MRIVVVGAGKVGYYLVKTLMDRGHRISLVEKDANRCRIIAEETGILTVNGDGTDLAALVDAGADTADVVAAVTGMDEVNLVVCQLAKNRLGVKKAVARVSNPKNREVLHRLGVDIAVSGTALIADAIEEEILYHDIRTLLRMGKSRFALVETVLPADSAAAGRTVRDLAEGLPRGCVFAFIIRGDEVVLPRGHTVLAPGDRVMAIVHPGEEEELRKSLQGGGRTR